MNGHELVRDVMHEGVITCRPDTPVTDVIETMNQHDVSALVVVDREGYAVGVISRTDLVNAGFVAPYLHHFRGMTAEHLMSSPVIAVAPDTPVTDAVALIREKRIHRLVVVRPEDPDHLRPVGILSMTDLVRELSDLEPGER
ncbi:MAG: CBS domain-containing protein [Chloroflexi bacterium]|nr:MAG: CBS domain-containing protein [Chloroflexota bacterium]